MTVWVIMDYDEFVAVAATVTAAREHAEALAGKKMAEGYYGAAAERKFRWDGLQLERYGMAFGRPGWHQSGFWLTETELIGRPDLPEVEAPGPLRVMSSTMCSCGDMRQVADLGSDNVFVPHVDARTGEPCRGMPLRGAGGGEAALAGFDSLPAGNGAAPDGGRHVPSAAPASDPADVGSDEGRADVARGGDDPWTFCPCGHPWVQHDIESHPGDGSEMCCVDRCDQNGCPGEAVARTLDVAEETVALARPGGAQ